LASYIALSARRTPRARVGAGAADHRDPDAGGEDRRVGPGQRLRDRVEQPEAELGRLLFAAHLLGDHDELVTAEAPDEVRAANGVREALTDLADHLVRAVVAERVVEHLEPVEVDEQDGDRRAGIVSDDRLVERLENRRSVGKAAQAVVPGIVHEPLERAVALDRDSGQSRAVLHQRQVLGKRPARARSVQRQRPQHLARRVLDRHRPAVSEPRAHREIADRSPLRILGDVLGDRELAGPGRRAARADVRPDHDAVDRGEIVGWERRGGPGTQRAGLAVEQHHAWDHRSIVALDALHQFEEHLLERRSDGDQLMDAVVGRDQLVETNRVVIGQSKPDLDGHRRRGVFERLEVALCPLARRRVGEAHRADHVPVDRHLPCEVCAWRRRRLSRDPGRDEPLDALAGSDPDRLGLGRVAGPHSPDQRAVLGLDRHCHHRCSRGPAKHRGPVVDLGVGRGIEQPAPREQDRARVLLGAGND
jgi:hypothetical protein